MVSFAAFILYGQEELLVNFSSSRIGHSSEEAEDFCHGQCS
jgi:hypothetical protein